MPYKASRRLPGERASRLAHLDVIASPLVRRLIDSFNETPGPTAPVQGTEWQGLTQSEEPLELVFGIDGSLQVITNPAPPHRTIAFVKTALLRLDRVALAAIDKDTPHPLAIRDLLADAAVQHSTVFPLRHIAVPGMTVYDTIRQTIFESCADPLLDRQPLETLKWLAFEKWDGAEKSLPAFECPNCASGSASLPYDAEQGACSACGGLLFLTDMLGFHLEMAQDSAPDAIASAYMAIHETLLLFTGVKYFWEEKRDYLSQALFVKDGPLSIRAQYSKLVNPIRRFLEFASESGHDVHLLGQEKSGAFFDHLEVIAPYAPENSVFVPSDRYIREQIQHRPMTGAPYGRDTNYGAKVFLKLDRDAMVLNIPTGRYKPNPILDDLVGSGRILSTLPSLTSSRYEGGLLPVELAHSIASLSTYPSAKVLALFAEAASARRV